MSNSFSSVGGNLQSHNIRSNFGTTRQDHIIQKIAEEMEQKEIKEKWREQFEVQVFDIRIVGNNLPLNSPKSKGTSKMMTLKEWNSRVQAFQYWESDDNPLLLSKEQFRKQFGKNVYTWRQNFDVVRVANSSPILKRRPQGLIAVHQQQVFDVIHKAHTSDCGHKAAESTHAFIKQHYYNISLAMVKTFIELCPTCFIRNHPKVPVLKGAKQPITTEEFRDRILADLIDYRNNPQHLRPGDPTSPTCQWLLVVKDHFTKLVYLRPLQTKSPIDVAYELNHIFCFMGYPMVFHTDNGNEFKGSVLAAIKEMNPTAACVTGRARTPSDQGSVERANRTIKPIIDAFVIDKQRLVDDPEEKKKIAWTSECSQAMMVMNKAASRAGNTPSPYELAFGGTPFDNPVFAMLQGQSTKDVHTVDQMRALLPESYEEKMKELGMITGSDCHKLIEEAAATAPDIESNDLVTPKKSPTTTHTTSTTTTPTAKKKSSTAGAATTDSKLLAAAIYKHSGNCLEDEISEDDYPEMGAASALPDFEYVRKTLFPASVTKTKAESPAKSSSLSVVKLEQNTKQRKARKYTNMSVRKALSLLTQNLPHKRDCVLATVACTHCTHGCRQSALIGIPIFSEQAINHYRTSKNWFPTALVGSYIDLLAHKTHKPGTRTVPCINPNEILSTDNRKTLPSDVTRLLVYANAQSHFALLDINISTRIIKVTDGLNYPPSTWKDHIIHILIKYNLVPSEIQYNSMVNTSTYKEGSSLRFKIPPINGSYILVHNTSVIQTDGYNCGPIVCGEAARILCDTHAGIQGDGDFTRNLVMNDYNTMVTECVSNDTLRVRRNNQLYVIDDADKVEHNSGETFSCGICLDKITDDEFKLPCAHTGHASCLSIWFRCNSSCIICRAEVNEVTRNQLQVLCEDTEVHTTSSVAFSRKRPPPTEIQKTINSVSQRKKTKCKDETQQLLIELKISTAMRKRQCTAYANALNREKNTKQNALMTKRFENSAKDLCLKKGDLVRVMVPKQCRARSNHTNITGIIYHVSEKTHCPYVVSEYGIIGNTKKTPESIKLDQFERMNQQTIPISPQLEYYRKVILQSQKPSSTTFPVMEITTSSAITKQPECLPLPTLHKLQFPDSNCGSNRCNCKGKCTTNKCKCRKNNTICGSGCKCTGDCDHSVALANKLKAEMEGTVCTVIYNNNA